VAYLPSVAVIYTELIKLVICVGAQGGVCLRTSGERGLTLREEISHQSREILGRSWPMVVPAALFVMQQVRHGLSGPEVGGGVVELIGVGFGVIDKG
jgi:hypothetical protein